MDSLSCKVCHTISSVTSYSSVIRCHGCQRTIFSGTNEPPIGGSKTQGETSFVNNDESADFNSFPRRNRFHLHRKTSPILSAHSSWNSQPPPRGKRALLCGVSYQRNKYKLKGTSKDVINMRNLLSQKFGFPDNAFLILAEDQQHQQPTKSNIIEAFKWLVADIQSDDSLVFYFSGHGLRQLSHDEDEIDGFDEAICPVDYETAGMIVDNEINQMIVAPLKEGVTLHAIVDTCHSGTLLDLPYTYNKNKGVWDPPLRVCKGTSGGHAICISACEDYQLAADTSIFSSDRTMGGAMTHTFLNAVNGKQEITYRGLLDSVYNDIQEANYAIRRGIRRLFQHQMLQDPILSASTPFNVDKVFKL